MLPDDFRWLIALDSLSAGIPVHHDAGWIEHEDRVIGDPFNQHSKTPLALLQLDDACSELLGALRDALLQVSVQFLKLFFRFPSRGYLAHAALVQTGVIDRDRSLCGKTHQNPFGALAEHTRLRMSEE
jgi:hypothetical protein